jgi:membrane protease subunit (stomatin/prohibitin family)
LGIKLKKCYVVAIQPNEETAKAISVRGARGALGVNYTQYQAGQAMREAAQNTSGGAAGTGVGVGAGIGLGQVMASAMQGGMNPTPAVTQSTAAATKTEIQNALTKLDIRFANGDISEATYNTLKANLEKALASAA